MKTIKSSGPLMYAVKSDKTPGIPKGKIHVFVVRYETYEYEANDGSFDETVFKVHDANCPEALTIARLVNG